MYQRCTSVWILDDHHLRRAGIVGLLASWAKRTSITLREADCFDEVLPKRNARETEGTSACILGIGALSLDDASIWAAISALVQAMPEQPLIIIADKVTPNDIATAVEHGVRGLIPTRMTAEVAIAAIEFILSGGTYFPHSQIAKASGVAVDKEPAPLLLTHFGGNMIPKSTEDEEDGADSPASPLSVGCAPAISELSRRQKDVLFALKTGCSNKEIARSLELSESTIKIHVRQLIRKFGVSNRTQVALLAPRCEGYKDHLRHA